jgi:hypothetical protein
MLSLSPVCFLFVLAMESLVAALMFTVASQQLKVTPWSRSKVCLEKLLKAHLVKKIPVLYEIRRFIIVFTLSYPVSFLSILILS